MGERKREGEERTERQKDRKEEDGDGERRGTLY